MFAKLSYTWELMRASWDVLKRDKRLLLFPLMSGVCCLLVLASFAIPIFVTGAWHPPGKAAGAARQVAYYGTLFAYYFVNYFVITFFNTGIVACAIERLRGGEPDVAFGFREAMARLPLIIGWALLSATVGLVLRVIEERSEKVGRIVAGLLGIAWGVVTYLVVPVLVVERKGPFAAMKTSGALLKQTWGEQIVGGFSFGSLFFFLAIPAIILIGGGIYAGMAIHSFALAGVCILTGVILFLALALVQSALQSIFQAAVYLYASGNTNQIASAGPQGFPVQLLQRAMAPK
jgi:hypothetical protein